MAGPSVIGALRVVLGADTGQFEDGLNKATRSLGNFNSKIGRGINIATAAIIGASSGMLAFAKHAAAVGDEIDDTSKRLGIGAEQFQELTYAAGLAGVSQEEMTSALEQFNKRLGEFKEGGGEAANALAQLGLRFDDVRNNSPDQALKLVAERIAEIPDPMRRAAIEADLFGKAGVKLDGVLTQGAAGLERMAKEARNMGLILSDDTIRQAGQASDEFDRMGLALKVAGVNIAVGMLPAITELRKVVTSPEFVGGVRTLGQAFGELILFLVKHKDELIGVAGAFAGMKVGATVGRLFGPLGVAIGGATGALVGWHAALKAAQPEMEGLLKRQKELQAELDKAQKGGVGTAMFSGPRDEVKNALIAELRRQLELVEGDIERVGQKLSLMTAGADAAGAGAGAPSPTSIMTSEQLKEQLDLQTQIHDETLSWAEKARTPLQEFQAELEKINEAYARGMMTTETYGALVSKVAFQVADAWGTAAQSAVSPWADALKTLSEENKKFAAGAKGLAIAEAIISTYLGATKALASGIPPFNYVAAAGVVAAGLANVAKIRAQEFQTGGSFTVGGMGGPDSQMISFRATPGEMVDVRKPGKEATPSEITVNMRGRELFNKDMIRDLFEAINDGNRDGYRLKLA